MSVTNGHTPGKAAPIICPYCHAFDGLDAWPTEIWACCGRKVEQRSNVTNHPLNPYPGNLKQHEVKPPMTKGDTIIFPNGSEALVTKANGETITVRGTTPTTNDPQAPYGEKPMTTAEMFEEWQKCLNDPAYFYERYCVVKDATMHWHIPNWMKAFEMIQPIKREQNGAPHPQHALNRMMAEVQWVDQRIASGELIVREELVAWLKKKDDAASNKEMLATNDAVKAVFVGEHSAFQQVLIHLNSKKS